MKPPRYRSALLFRTLLLLPVLAGVSACGVAPTRAPPLDYYDFGIPRASATLPCCAAQVALEPVEYAPMLADQTMWYRQGAASVQPRAFAFSRWSAEPASLLEQHVRVSLGVAESDRRSRLPYRLSLKLETMEQVFPNGDSSEVRLIVSAALTRTADATLLDSRVFSLVQAGLERSPNAGAMGLAGLVAELGGQLQAWICAQIQTCPPEAGGP